MTPLVWPSLVGELVIEETGPQTRRVLHVILAQEISIVGPSEKQLVSRHEVPARTEPCGQCWCLVNMVGMSFLIIGLWMRRSGDSGGGCSNRSDSCCWW